MVDLTIQGDRAVFKLIIEVSDVAGTVARLRAALGAP
jgi:hypothetical protein